jgi:uncharacterized protein (UPF0305 family)
LKEEIKDKYISIEYKTKAHALAQAMNHQGLGKKDVLALGYRQVLDSLNLENTVLDDVFYGATKTRTVAYITPDDRNQYLARHKSFLRAIIDELETEAHQERQQLAERQKTADTVENRLDQIQQKQEVREKALDQQILAVQDQIQRVQAVLSKKPTPKVHSPDFDRLEKMLDELRRLKIVG